MYSAQYLAFYLSPLCRLAVLVQCKPVPWCLWHSEEWQRDYSGNVWFTSEYRVELDYILSLGSFAATAESTTQNQWHSLQETINLRIEKCNTEKKGFPVYSIQMLLWRAAQIINYWFSISSLNICTAWNKTSEEDLCTLPSHWSVKGKIKITMQNLP